MNSTKATDILRRALGVVTQARPSEISKQTRRLEHTELLRALTDFNGTGWLVTAKSKELAYFQTGQPISILPGDVVLQGEASNGPKSIHFRYSNNIWTLDSFEDLPGSISFTEELRGRGQRILEYRVFYAPASAGTHDELRPLSFRFTGFK